MVCMSTEVILKINSTSSNETEQLGESVGKNLKGGEVIELVSDLGGGKTTFVRGLAKGMGSLDVVSSPSFTIQQDYRTQDLTMHHFDFYRLHEPGILEHELAEVVRKKDAVTVVEWADIVQGVLPKKRIRILFRTTNETDRELRFNCPEALKYLLAGLK